MKFNLDYTPPKAGFEISHGQRILLTGSCFSENIGRRLKDLRFDCLSNSSGILFNPLSIHLTIENWIQENETHPNYILERGGEYFCFLHHSSVKAASGEELCEQISRVNADSLQFLKTAEVLILTFGSAWYYWHKTLNTAVANCHKQPSGEFEKRLLTVNEIVKSYHELVAQLLNLNPGLKIIFTISPVKYLRDGIVENNISKSTLLLATHEIVNRNKASCFYFPAYELVSDDLRDYRFYKEDLAHPNEQAIDYVWEKFSACFFAKKTLQINEKISRLNAIMQHRPLHNNREETLKAEEYRNKLLEEIRSLDPAIRI